MNWNGCSVVVISVKSCEVDSQFLEELPDLACVGEAKMGMGRPDAAHINRDSVAQSGERRFVAEIVAGIDRHGMETKGRQFVSYGRAFVFELPRHYFPDIFPACDSQAMVEILERAVKQGARFF